MATIQVRLPDGSLQTMSHPDDWSDEQVRSAIKKNFPQPLPKEGESFFQKALRYGVKDPLLGIVKVGQNIQNAPYNIASSISQKAASYMPRPDVEDYSAFFGLPEEKKTLADRAIQFAPNLGTALILPEAKLGSVSRGISSIPKVGKYLQAALGNALSQGAYAATQSPEDQGGAAKETAEIAAPFSALSKAALSGSPVLKTVSRGALGLGGGLLGYHGAKSIGASDTTADLVGALLGLGGIKGLNPRQAALKGVEGTDYQSALDAAKRLGLSYITPAEASGNPFTGAEQGTMGKTEKGAQLLYQKGLERAESEKGTIGNLLRTIFNPETQSQKVNSLYATSRPVQVSEESLKPFRENEIFKHAESKLLNDPAYNQALKGVSPNSVGYLDLVKRTMDDMIKQSEGKQPFKVSLVKGTQSDLLKVMDEAAPEYAEARSLAERDKARKKIEGAFNVKPMTGTNLGKFLNNEKQYTRLQNNLRNVPDAQQQLEDMKLVFNRLINIPTAKSAEALSRSSMSKDRASSATAIRMLKEMLSGGRYDKASIDLITNPSWADELQKLKQISNTDRFIGRAYDVLGKAGAQSVGQQNQ